MNLIVITGLPASGKSRLARAASERFGYPILEKDRIKEGLFDTVGFSNYAEKRALDHEANDLLLKELRETLENGRDVIVDNNFDAVAAEKLPALLKTYQPALAVVELTGPIELFYERYVRRDSLAKRHIGHALQDHYPLRPGEEFSFSMSLEGYKERFVDRGMASAKWAPDRIRVDVSGGELPVEETLERIQMKLNEAKEGSERKIVVFPFRSFPTLIGEGVAAELEEAGFEVRANRTGRTPDEAELKEMIRDAFAVVAGSERYTAEVLRAAKNLRLIVRHGVGLDKIDLDAAKELGIELGVISNDYAVAEHALMLMLALLRKCPERDRGVRSGIWSHETLHELRGKTVGLLGFGRIGKRLARLLSGFEVRILASDPYFDREAGEQLGVEPVGFEELLRQSDVLSLHLPGMKENEGIISEKALSEMKPGAFLINTARGILVDEEALAKALASGKLSGAALDTFRKEPLPADSPLLSLPNLIVTPHTAALTEETNSEGCRTIVRSIISVAEGGKPVYPVWK
ncbi:MAG: AAA family ATPase [Lachnospiraceae bacterium]|nr:AAA family ATPase [Lachnospiraceae bacterium]